MDNQAIKLEEVSRHVSRHTTIVTRRFKSEVELQLSNDGEIQYVDSIKLNNTEQLKQKDKNKSEKRRRADIDAGMKQLNVKVPIVCHDYIRKNCLEIKHAFEATGGIDIETVAKVFTLGAHKSELASKKSSLDRSQNPLRMDSDLVKNLTRCLSRFYSGEQLNELDVMRYLFGHQVVDFYLRGLGANEIAQEKDETPKPGKGNSIKVIYR